MKTHNVEQLPRVKNKNFAVLYLLKFGWSPGEGLSANGLKEPIQVFAHVNGQGLGYASSSSMYKDILDNNHSESLTTRDLPSLPEIKVRIYDMEITCLIDTGAQVTAIASDIFDKLKSKVGDIMKVIQVPNIQLKGAIGQRSQKVNKLVLLPIEIGEDVIHSPCLVVEKLIRPIILGFNWLQDNKVRLCCGVPSTISVGSLGNKQFEINSFLTADKTIELDCETYECNCIESDVVEEVILNPDLNSYIKSLNIDNLEEAYLKQLLIRRQKVFTEKLGCTNLYEHRIKMIDETPFVKYPYPVPLAYRDKVEEKIKEMEKQNIIRRAATPYASPLTYTLKKDGSVRVLLDARELNTRIEGETEKPPLITEVLQQFLGV